MRYVLLLLILFAGFASPAHALDVDQVRFGIHKDRTRLVLDLSEVRDFRVFSLREPARLVIDLPSFNWRASPIDQPKGAGILSVRHGNLKPGISRIVFDFSKDISVVKAFALSAHDGKPNRLVIDFAAPGQTLFRTAKEQIFGTLSDESQFASIVTPNVGANTGDAAYSSMVPPVPERKNVKPLVVIDAGHGGVDPGAIGANGVFEKHVTLSLAKELKKQLLDTGEYRVLLTREKDIFIKLADRVRFARDHGADLFISIHADSLNRSNVHGASIYTLSEKASDAQTAKLAARENRADLIAGIDLNVEDDDVANILVDLAMRDTMNQSKFFANSLVQKFEIGGVNLLESPHRYAGFAVLKAPDIPSVLVEAGFMSNRREADLLNSPGHRRKIAQALRAGINSYFEQARKTQRL